MTALPIAVDAMGGDHGPSVTVPASIAFLEETPDAAVVLVGRVEALQSLVAKQRSAASVIRIRCAKWR